MSDEDILAVLPTDRRLRSLVVIERVLVPGGWEEGWKDHFKPLTVGRLYIRPPWEPEPARHLLDIVLTPGLAFGTGLHPTTRGVLGLLQALPAMGPIVDAGTGSGILSIGAAKLGYGPIRAFDNDPLAVEAARTNCAANGAAVEVAHCDVTAAPSCWFEGATVLANITLGPVLALLARLIADGLQPPRIVVAGILSGEQEAAVVRAARDAGWRPASRQYETEWVSMDLRRAAGISPIGVDRESAAATAPLTAGD